MPPFVIDGQLRDEHKPDIRSASLNGWVILFYAC